MLVDTSVLVSAADASEPNHAISRSILEAGVDKLVTDAILSEAHHLICARVGWDVGAAFLHSIDHDVHVENSVRSDRERALELCLRYLDARLDYTDALTIAIAERIGDRVVATLDAAHFRIVRPAHVDSFEVIP